MEKYCLGIDVDKKSLNCCFVLSVSPSIKVKASRSFANSDTGFSNLLAWMGKHRKLPGLHTCVVMEATGVYHEKLAYFLHCQNINVHVVLPLRAKHYMSSIGHRSKTDKMDAKGLAYMGCQQELEPWEKPDATLAELRSLTRQIEALHHQKAMLKNQREALEHAGAVHREAARSNQKIIKALEQEVARLERHVAKLVDSNASLRQKYALFTPLKGIGLMSFAVIASETDGFALFKNQRQLASYSGYDVIENQSGQRAGRTRISKKGNTHIRRILHMAAWSAVSHNVAPFRQLYDRVYERTGIKMKGYVAVQRKLLAIFYTLWKKDKPFEPEYANKISSIHEPSSSFREVSGNKKIATSGEMATLDRHPCNQVA